MLVSAPSTLEYRVPMSRPRILYIMGSLAANDLVEVEVIAQVTSRLIVNRAALKTRSAEVSGWIDRFREAADAA